MRLKDKNAAIPGGLWYEYSDNEGHLYRVNGMDLPYGNQFIQKIKGDMGLKHVEVPGNLEFLVEQQICARIPSGLYWQEAGDAVATVAHTFARLGDKVASSFGINTNLEVRAKNCPACKKRREKLNQIGR